MSNVTKIRENIIIITIIIIIIKTRRENRDVKETGKLDVADTTVSVAPELTLTWQQTRVCVCARASQTAAEMKTQHSAHSEHTPYRCSARAGSCAPSANQQPHGPQKPHPSHKSQHLRERACSIKHRGMRHRKMEVMRKRWRHTSYGWSPPHRPTPSSSPTSGRDLVSCCHLWDAV